MTSSEDEIIRLRAELRKRDEQLKQRDHDLKHLQNKYSKLEDKNKKLTERNDELQHRLDVMNLAGQALTRVMENYAPEEIYTQYSGMTDVGNRLVWFINYCQQILLQDKKLKKFLFGHGSTAPKKAETTTAESGDPATAQSGKSSSTGNNSKTSAAQPAGKDAINELLAKSGNDDASKKLVLALASNMIDALDNVKVQTELVEALRGRSEDSSELQKSSAAKPSRGKQKHKGTLRHIKERSELEKLFNRRLSKSQTEILQEWICPQCGAVGDCSLHKMTRAMLDSFAAAGLIKLDDNGCFIITEEHSDVVCKQCGYSEPAQDPNPPVLPGHRISLALAVQVALYFGSGFPINAFENSFLSGSGLGHSTLLDAVHDLASLLYPLYKWTGEMIDEAPAVGADETTIRTYINGVLKRSYMCAKITQPGVWPAGVFFYPPDSRSKTSEVTAGLEGGVLSSDALRNYTKTEGIHQMCLAHLAVRVWEAFEVRNTRGMAKLVERVKNLTPEELILLDLSKDDNALLALTMIYYKLACVFAFESKAAESLGPQDGDKLYASRQELRSRYSAPIMKDIEYIFTRLRPYYAVQSGTDKKTGLPVYQCVDQNNPICSPVVYWANSHGAFLSFLGEPMTSADNLSCERLMRVVSRIRDASQTLHSDEGGEALAVFVSCMHTASLCGVTSVATYLFEVASYVQQQGAREISLLWFNDRAEALKADPDAVIKKRNYNQPEVYRNIKLPEHLQPHVWAAAHDGTRSQA